MSLSRTFISTGAHCLVARRSGGHLGDMDQAAFLIELADDLRELLSRSAGQNDGRTLIRKRRAVTAPMPEPAPVTMTNLPSNRWKPIRFSSAPSVPVYSPFSSRRSAIAEEIRSLEGRRREPGTHFQRYGGALG